MTARLLLRVVRPRQNDFGALRSALVFVHLVDPRALILVFDLVGHEPAVGTGIELTQPHRHIAGGVRAGVEMLVVFPFLWREQAAILPVDPSRLLALHPEE